MFEMPSLHSVFLIGEPESKEEKDRQDIDKRR